MKFFNSRIVTKTVQLADALKADKKPDRKLDEVLADIKSKGQVKTASSGAQVKTAEDQVKTASSEAQVKTAEDNLVDTPMASSENEVKEAKKKLPPEFLENIKGKGGKKKEKEEAKCADNEAKCASSAPKTLKMAKSLDFRQWAAEDVVTAWGQHGSFEKCVANVDGLVNEPKTYCKLLQVASGKADAIVKTAAKKAAATKKASPKGVFKKLAKLSDDELSFLREYWRNLYGDEYVDSMTKDY